MQVAPFRAWPLVVFVAIACGIVWLLLGASQLLGIPFMPLLIIGSWSPNIAAFIVIGIVLREKGGIRELFMGWVRWRFPTAWYLVALSAPALAALALPVLALFGEQSGPHSPVTPGGVLTIVAIEIVTGAAGEELGWRGFLQVRLQRKFSPLVSALIVGVAWAGFHAPLWLAPGQAWASLPFGYFALVCVSSSVVMSWLVNGTGGSTAVASLYHFLMNAGLNVVLLFGVPAPKLYAAYAALLTLFATVPVLFMAMRGREGAPRQEDAVIASGRGGPRCLSERLPNHPGQAAPQRLGREVIGTRDQEGGQSVRLRPETEEHILLAEPGVPAQECRGRPPQREEPLILHQVLVGRV
jgi:membrane protease YdiL (CAAX protease family)